MNVLHLSIFQKCSPLLADALMLKHFFPKNKLKINKNILNIKILSLCITIDGSMFTKNKKKYYLPNIDIINVYICRIQIQNVCNALSYFWFSDDLHSVHGTKQKLNQLRILKNPNSNKNIDKTKQKTTKTKSTKETKINESIVYLISTTWVLLELAATSNSILAWTNII